MMKNGSVSSMKPLIGITCDYDLNADRMQVHSDYCRAIYAAGGLPVVLPYIDVHDLCSLASRLDGIVFTGGGDIDPHYFGENPHYALGQVNPIRDEVEIGLCTWAMDNDKPILGICRGIQVMNVAMGGTLYQDIAAQLKSEVTINHSQTAPGWHPIHDVRLEAGSRISSIMGQQHIRVNSFHHQAIREVATPFCVAGRSDDGIVEVIESRVHTFALGVQWHPERMYRHHKNMLLIFKAFVEACSRNRP